MKDEPCETAQRPRRHSARLELAVLLVVLALVPQFYLWGLGYYVDDWELLKVAGFDSDGSFASTFAAYTSIGPLAVRPVMNLWLAAFNTFAPGNVLAAHLANQVVFAASCLVLFRALRSLPTLCDAAFPLVLIYCCMPHFVTTRLWFANHQANLGLLFFALAFYAMARLSRSPRRAKTLIAVIALSTLASALAYELFVFTLIAAPAFIWLASGATYGETFRDRRFRGALAGALAGFILAVLYKLPAHYGFSALSMDRGFEFFALRSAYVYLRAAIVSFWVFGAFIPVVAAGVLMGPFFEPVSLAAAGIVLVATGLAVCRRHLRAVPAEDAQSRSCGPRFFMLAGLIAFGLGYLPFLTNSHFAHDPFGTANRVNVGSALGTVLVFYAAYLKLRQHARTIAGTALALYCAAGIFLQVSIARTWVSGWSEQQALYADMIATVGTPREGDIVLLYGACPFHGAAPVFLWYWGLTPRLQLEAGRQNVVGDVIIASTQVRPEGVVVVDPDKHDSFRSYPYGSIKVFNVMMTSATRLRSYDDARAYFARHPVAQSTSCDYHVWGSERMYDDPLPVLDWLETFAEKYRS